MNSLGLLILATLSAIILFAPKRWALMGAAAGILYLTQGQQLEIAGINLYAVRFIEVAAFFRVVLRKEISFAALNKLDGVFVLLYCYTLGVFLLRSNEDQVFQIGQAVDALLSYFAFRGLVTNLAEFRWFLKTFLVLLAPFTLLVIYETLTTRNPFNVIGGVELIQAGDRWFRDGRMRATGSFGHPSLMGTLGGSFLPLYIALWLAPRERRLAIAGVILCVAIVWASNSGGPATCIAVALLGWMLWPLRASMQWVRRGAALMIIGLAISMKAPIWYLLARISNITGGDGYHRSALLDVAFQNIDKWWLAGMRALDTSTWLPYTNTNTGAVDMTNNFLVFGITAGLGAMVLLIYLLVQAFKHVGRALVVVRSQESREDEYMLWGLGVALGVHLFNWFGITYWDQSNLLWFMHLALAGSLSASLVMQPTETAELDRTSASAQNRPKTLDRAFNRRAFGAMGAGVRRGLK